MNLFTFALRTSAFAFYFLPSFFGIGTAWAIADGTTDANVVWSFAMFGVVVYAMYLMKTAQHRERLRLSKLSRYPVYIVHNAKDGLPTEQRVMEVCADMIDNPLDPFNP